ncbi:hypothetical protein R3X49_25035, partial [Salmonella enterica subsp. enterica serovar Weltevreden]|uniref:hypothetical protein n=1 Tax=Salmonella enterica TaxID=28901 RepID=UPI002A752A88
GCLAAQRVLRISSSEPGTRLGATSELFEQALAGNIGCLAAQRVLRISSSEPGTRLGATSELFEQALAG